jgi:hypothetical protein
VCRGNAGKDSRMQATTARLEPMRECGSGRASQPDSLSFHRSARSAPGTASRLDCGEQDSLYIREQPRTPAVCHRRCRFSRRYILELPVGYVYASKVAAVVLQPGLPDLASQRAASKGVIPILNIRRSSYLVAVFACMLAWVPATASAQDKDSFTPMPLDSGFGRMDVNPPPVPAEQIIKEFAAKESEFQDALNHYTYRRYARVQTLDDDNKVDGEWYEVDDVTFDSTGRRTEKVVFAPGSTLQRVMMSPSDLQDISHGYPFVLTTEEIAQYDVKFIGRQKVDEVDCYVFEVEPKLIEKNKRYFLGRIWVDATDLQIVVTNGRMVPDDTRKGKEDLHPPFMTWRAQVDGHYWFPVYTKGEGILHFSSGNGFIGQDVHIRDTVKYTDYKRFGSTSKIIFGGQTAPDPNQPTSQPPATPQKKK